MARKNKSTRRSRKQSGGFWPFTTTTPAATEPATKTTTEAQTGTEVKKQGFLSGLFGSNPTTDTSAQTAAPTTNTKPGFFARMFGTQKAAAPTQIAAANPVSIGTGESVIKGATAAPAAGGGRRRKATRKSKKSKKSRKSKTSRKH